MEPEWRPGRANHMKLGIRFKLVGLLMITGVLPLLASLAVLVFEGGRLRRTSVGRSFESLAATQAGAMVGVLREDIEDVVAHCCERDWMAAVTSPPRQRSPEELRRLDALWETLGADSPEMAAVLDHPLARPLRHLRQTRQYCREIFLTDRHGQLVAASNRTSDYYQADERWWQMAYDQGRGTVFVSPVRFDASSEVWSIDVCVPVYTGPARKGQVAGVLKAVFDLESWVTRCVQMKGSEGAKPVLLSADGTVVFAAGVVPLTERADHWVEPAPGSQTSGWEVVGGNLRAYAVISLPDKVAGIPISAPRWYITVQTPARRALGPMYRLSRYVLIIGLALIVVAFGVGMLLANRQIVRPLKRLRSATERVAAGDLSRGLLKECRRRGAGDEIGQLARHFNRMVAAVEKSHATLAHASEMKTRFIRVAGHELRTPVAYILAMTDLLVRDLPDGKLRSSLQRLRNRAGRLETITTRMFKLLDVRRDATNMNYSTFDAQDLAQAVTDEMQPFAEGRSQRILIETIEDPPAITADRQKLHDALANLLSNAIKFTPEGGVIRITIQRQDGDRLAIGVQDQGQGISEEELPHLFETFWGGRDTLTHSTGAFGYRKRGAGLGLVVARQYVRLHGGTIQVANSPNGCVFSIIIPVAPPVTGNAPQQT